MVNAACAVPSLATGNNISHFIATAPNKLDHFITNICVGKLSSFFIAVAVNTVMNLNPSDRTYNPETKECETFNYGGCDAGASKNRFKTQELCQATCVPKEEV